MDSASTAAASLPRLNICDICHYDFPSNDELMAHAVWNDAECRLQVIPCRSELDFFLGHSSATTDPLAKYLTEELLDDQKLDEILSEPTEFFSDEQLDQLQPSESSPKISELSLLSDDDEYSWLLDLSTSEQLEEVLSPGAPTTTQSPEFSSQESAAELSQPVTSDSPVTIITILQGTFQCEKCNNLFWSENERSVHGLWLHDHQEYLGIPCQIPHEFSPVIATASTIPESLPDSSTISSVPLSSSSTSSSEPKKFKCTHDAQCPKSYKTRWGLRQHIRDFHKKKKPEKCLECPYVCSQKDKLATHILGHKNPSLRHKCRVCNFRADSPNGIAIHQKLHKNE